VELGELVKFTQQDGVRVENPYVVKAAVVQETVDGAVGNIE
jgi:hypothetical protein